MKLPTVDRVLASLATLIQEGRFEELETDTLEIKSVPADGAAWHELHKSIDALLNTRGGIVLLGIKEVGAGAGRHYEMSGWQPHAEPNLKEIPRKFTDRRGAPLDLSDCFPPPQLLDFLNGRIAVLLVDELAADRRFAFYRGVAYRRIVTGDHRISDSDIERQEDFREEALHARELQPVEGASLANLDLDQLNDYINHLNQPVRVETLKPTLDAATPFLERRAFLKNGRITTLGMLVCGAHVTDFLGFRCQVHCYIDVPNEIARDKQDLVGNILPLMESGLAYVLRNIRIGISPERGGASRPEYPEDLLRETVNNALAHRDFAVNRQVIIAIKPGKQISIRNPGAFRKQLLLEDPDVRQPIHRILPEATPRNPKLADVLRVYQKWEGRGIGMSRLVDLCLGGQIDLPYYHLGTSEVTLHLRSGRLIDEQMGRLFQSFDGYIEKKLSGKSLTVQQRAVLAYLIKSQRINEQVGYTILLTPDNNHFNELRALEMAGLISKHRLSTASHPVYVADAALTARDYLAELRALFRHAFDALDPFLKEILGVVYRFHHFSRTGAVNAKQTSFSLWYERGGDDGDIKSFEAFDRKVRRSFNKLRQSGFVVEQVGARRYLLNDRFLEQHLV